MTKFEAFCIANPTDKRVVRIEKMSSGRMMVYSRLGKAIGDLMREEGL